MATNPPTLRCIRVTQPFKLADVLDGTQDFRWRRLRNGWRSGVLAGNLLHLRQVEGDLEYRAKNDLTCLLRRYFRLDDKLDEARAKLATVDPELAAKYPSLRVLRQPDPWECMVAYLCSARNSVICIGAMVEKMAERLGQPVELDGDVRYTFPTPAKVVEAGEETLAEMQLGLDRGTNIVAAARKIYSRELNLQDLAQCKTPYAPARRELRKNPGVGRKIADCIALFALDKPEAFPVDTWIKGALTPYFPDGKVPSDPTRWARDRFGRNAGLASQLLFRSQRESIGARREG